MTHDEISTLLYLETRAVDYDGIVDSLRMNRGDMVICRKWNESGFINFGRISSAKLQGAATHYVELSDKAWAEAHAQRRERAERGIERRSGRTIIRTNQNSHC